MCYQRQKLTREFPSVFLACISPSFRRKRGVTRLPSYGREELAVTDRGTPRTIWRGRDACGPRPTPFLRLREAHASRDGTDRTRLRLTNNSHCPVGPHHPWNLPSEVSRKSTLMPGHPHLNSAEPGLGSAGSPARGEAGAGVPGRGAHVVSGRGTCSSDPRRREGSTAPRGRRDPPRRRGGEGRGGPCAPGPGAERSLSFRRCRSNCSSLPGGWTPAGRHKFEWGGNFDFLFLNGQMHWNSI